MRNFPIRPALTILTFAVLLWIAGSVRSDIHGLSAALFTSPLDFRPARMPSTPEAAPFAVRPSSPLPHPFLEDPSGALNHFFDALWRSERKEPGAVTRIVHYGDSPTTADLITADARALLQHNYGDAGLGFILAAKPWAWYAHRGVQLSGSGWSIHTPIHPDLRDRMYGLGGVAFITSGEATTRLVLQDQGQTSVEVSFLRQPGGGTITVSSGELTLGQVDTAAETAEAGFAAFDLHPPTKEIEIHAAGNVRVFGITLEKAGTGVVYDSLGLNGAFTTILAHTFDQRHWTEQLQHRKPDLLILNYGTNESGFAPYVDKVYEKELRLAVSRLRAALPQCSLLIMSPMDRAERESGDEVRTLASLPRLVEIQRRVALETGCAFFDTFHAMGGDGTAARWYDAHPRLMSADFIHPTPAGARLVGERFYRALSQGLGEYKVSYIRKESMATKRIK